MRIANAPVSYGAYELTVGVLPNVPGPDEVLDAIAEAGYDATELGPLGYLGDGEALRRRLDARGLDLAGAFVQIPFAERDAELDALRATLDVLAFAPGGAARPVFADASSLPLDWSRFADGVARAAELARSRGFQPVFHHHANTGIETPAEIERLLELSDVGLLLDTGHLTVAGGDVVACTRAWRDRIEYVHVKDVRVDVLQASNGFGDASARGVFCDLGAGDVDLAGFFTALGAYDGWLVVEQDWIPAPDEPATRAIESQRRNRRWLGDHLDLHTR